MTLVVATPAAAGPPYVTDDPEPTDLGKWENYAFVSGSGLGDGVEGATGFDINYGAATNLQASAVVAFAYARDGGARVHVGIADTEIGLKYRFLHQREGSWLPDVGLFPKVELPTAGGRFGSGRVGFQLPFWAQKDHGPWSVFGGGGYQIDPGIGNRSFAFEGIGLTRQVAKTLAIGGEVYHQAADSIDGHATTGIGVGASWQVARHWSIIGSGGPLLGAGDRAPRYAFYFALHFHN